MAGRISRGWSLFKQSWEVLRLDKELMLFPVLSSISCLLVLASFVAPVLLVPEWRDAALKVVDPAQRANAEPPPAEPQEAQIEVKNDQTGFQVQLPSVIFFCFYLVNFFVIVFFNTALVSCAVLRFSGGDPTVGYGLRAAFARLPQILAWALFAATIGMILKMIEERASFIGKLVVNLIGVAWSIVTYLVVPVLAVERVGPIQAVKRSAELLCKSWGESLTSNISFGIVGFLLALPGIGLLIATPFLAVLVEPLWWAVASGVLGLLYLVVLSIVTSTLQQILLAGIYLYAANGTVPSGFSADVMQTAFRHK